MSLLAETVVEEWLNQQGYFTIRGIKLGVQEIDLLAVNRDGHCRHVEVQASSNPIAYVTRVPKQTRKEHNRAANSAKRRTGEELTAGAKEWIANKFHLPKKVAVRNSLHPGPWTLELVLHRIRHADEIPHIEAQGISVIWLSDIVRDLRRKSRYTAAGRDLVELVNIELGDTPAADVASTLAKL